MSLMLRARPLTYRLLAKAFSNTGGLQAAASERIELAAGSQVQSFDAIALPEEEFRATGTMSMTHESLAYEQKSARACRAVHGPTIAYRIDDALIADGCCYAGGRFDSIGARRRRWVLPHLSETINEAQLCSEPGSEQFFGHWLCDAMCTELLAHDRRLLGLSFAGSRRPHEPGYRELLSLPAHAVSAAHVRRLWVIDDRGYNPPRIERLLRLRRRLRSKVAPSGERLVFLDRGTGGAARHLLNREAVVNELARRGFAILSPEQMTVHALARALCGARLVVGVEGSHLNHALLALPEGAAILAIQPPDRFNMFNKYIAEFASLHFGFVVAEAADGGFTLALDRLTRTIALFEAYL